MAIHEHTFARTRTSKLQVVMAVFLTACTHWQVQPVSPQRVLEARQPSKMRVTRADHASVVLLPPRLVRDTLYGSSGPHAASDPSPEGIALADVTEVAIRRFDPVGTTALGLGSTAVLAGAAAAILFASQSARWE